MVGEIALTVVVSDDSESGEVIDGNGEETVDLRGVERHGQYAVDASGHQQIRDEASAE